MLIEQLLDEAITARIFPGAVVQISGGGVALHTAAYGSTMYGDPGSRPLAADDYFDIASLTKVVTATAALALYDAKELDLEREARYYLAGLAADEVRVRHLLSHCSGLELRLAPLRTLGAMGLRQAVWAARPSHAPGTLSAYTNINSLLLGEVVAAVSGMPLARALDELVLGPLEMGATGFCPPSERASRIVPTEWDREWRGGLIQGVVHDESAYTLGGVAGHAGLFSTASDLEHLMRLWLETGAWAGRQLLREATVALALTNQLVGVPTATGAQLSGGLGWMLERANFMGAAPEGSFGHTGFTGTALIGVPTRKLSLVLLSNRTYPQRTPPPHRHHAVTAALLEAALAL
jgi:CubicO group peptidase (beta-lactamase class C family)